MAQELLSTDSLRSHLRVPDGHDVDLIEAIKGAATRYIEETIETAIVDRQFNRVIEPPPPAGCRTPLEIKLRGVKSGNLTPLTIKHWTPAGDLAAPPDGEIADDKLRLEANCKPYPVVYPAEGWPASLASSYWLITGTAGLDEVPANVVQAAKQVAGYLYDHPTELRSIPRMNAVELLLKPSIHFV